MSAGEFSLGRHAAVVLGSATVVLGLTTLVLWLLRPSGTVGLIVVTIGLAATYAVASLVAKRSVRRSFDGHREDEKSP